MGIIKSNRKFGVEIEGWPTDYKKLQVIRDLISEIGSYQFVHDGSIRKQNGVEVVSPILQGANGERSLTKICDILKEYGFSANDVSCGLHVHHDGSDILDDEYIVSKEEPKDFVSVLHADQRDIELWRERYPDPLDYARNLASQMGFLNGMSWEGNASGGSTVQDAKGVQFRVIWSSKSEKEHTMVLVPNKEYNNLGKEYEQRSMEFSKEYDYTGSTRHSLSYATLSNYGEPLKVKPSKKKILSKKEYMARQSEIEQWYDSGVKAMIAEASKNTTTFYFSKNTKNFTKLKNLFYFYKAFDEVFLHMMPESRRRGNTYCMPLSHYYKLEEIEKIKDPDEFEKYWYKARDKREASRRKGQHRDDSRYQDINFHALFNHGTIEIRSHFGETDARKILFWVALHQYIIDLITGGGLDIKDIREVGNYSNVRDKANLLFKITKMPSHLVEYVQHYLSHFSNIKF